MPPPLTRLSAFTLLELLITMAVSAVLLSMAYLALRIVERQQYASVRTLQELRQANTLQWLLARDFRRAQRVSMQGGELRCELPGYVVSYQLQDFGLLRQQLEVTDTFDLPVLRERYWLQGHPLPTTGGLLDEVSLTLRFRHDTLHLQAHTWYDATQLLSAASTATAKP